MPDREAKSTPPDPGSPPALPPGLIYVNDSLLPGIFRERAAAGFRYRLPDDSVLRDESEILRIRRLAIPPAYTDVWICPLANGHLQATGRDARGRKQYRYHADWNSRRNADKFARLEAFGRTLPRVRRRVARDLASDDGRSVTYRVVLATLVRLLDTTFVRIGNEAYARENRSYGLTTLRNRHVVVAGTGLRLTFRGKHGIRQEVGLDDARVVRIVRRCKQLPGQELFQYVDNGVVRGIGSGEVNDYLSEAAGERFTAKDFRTWHGTVEALELTRLACSAPSDSAGGYSAQKILAAVARRLGNTVAVCRKSYVHPEVLALGQRLASDSATTQAVWERFEGGRLPHAGLHAAERRLLNFLAEYRKQLRQKKRQQIKASTTRPSAGVQ